MKINRQFFHLPPFLSTSWKAILALHVEKKDSVILFVTLNNGSRVEIPGLSAQIIDAIFKIHAQVLEQENVTSLSKVIPSPIEPPTTSSAPTAVSENPVHLNIPLFPGIGENLGTFLQHNPEQANIPDLPFELLEKIAGLSKTLGIQETNSLPKAEPHCNCHFCQVARAMHGELDSVSEKELSSISSEEEEISEEDLKFRSWDIHQTAENLYIVTNPIDSKEYYSVFLGDPIGCTCGDKNCDHIRAVLSS